MVWGLDHTPPVLRSLVDQGLLGSDRGRKLLPGVCSVLKADKLPGRPEGGGRERVRGRVGGVEGG